MAKKMTLAEAMAESARVADVSGLRELVEKTIGEREEPCGRSLDFLIPMLGRRALLKERFLASGHDWFRASDDADAPGWEAWTKALEKSEMDTYQAFKTWKAACMRRRPEEQ